MIVLRVGMERFFSRAPALLIAVAVGIAGAGLLGLQAYGVELVGHIPKGLPSLTMSDFSLATKLWPGAVGIALMSFTETTAAGRACARTDEPALRPNQELLANRERGRRFTRSAGCRWRHHPNGREAFGRGAYPTN
jgi:MFS superfamily sulfate permease-like transporter